MLNLLEHTSGRALEPSAGAGDLVALLEKNTEYSLDAVELDSSLGKTCETPITYQDFFSYAQDKDNSYDVIFGNPPYVAWKNMEAESRVSAQPVKEGRYPDKTNLYHLFIDRCIDLLAPGGEMVFIVPKEWLYTSSARALRNKVIEEGSLTHVVDCGEEKLFVDADVPAILIFRFVKGTHNPSVVFAPSLTAAHEEKFEDRLLVNTDGRYLLLDESLADETSSWGQLKDAYRVRVGIVSGADKVFRVVEGTTFGEEGIREYVTTKGVEKFIDVNHYTEESGLPEDIKTYLLPHKEALLKRGIAKFTEDNWWKYGAIRNKEHMLSSSERIYAYAKTRSQTPFFLNEVKFYGGGILGLFKVGEVSVEKALLILNSKRYRQIMESMFLTTANKVSLQPATLEDAPFPTTDEDAEHFIQRYNL